MDIERHVSWPVAFFVRHSCIFIPRRFPKSATQLGGGVVRPGGLHNLESVVVVSFGHRDCRRVFDRALVAWSTLVVDFVDGDVFVSRGTFGSSAGPGGQVASRGIATKQVGKVLRKKCVTIQV